MFSDTNTIPVPFPSFEYKNLSIKHTHQWRASRKWTSMRRTMLPLTLSSERNAAGPEYLTSLSGLASFLLDPDDRVVADTRRASVAS